MFENFKKITIKGGCFENETELELFKKDAVTVVYGRNGSGKTTIANAMKTYIKDKTGEAGDGSTKELEVTTDAEIPKENCGGVYVFDEEFVGSQVRVKKDGISTIVMLGEQVELDEKIAKKKEKLAKLEKDWSDLKELQDKYEDASVTFSPLYYYNKIRDGLREEGGWADIDRDVKGNTLKSRVSVDLIYGLLNIAEPKESYTELRKKLKADLKLYMGSVNAEVIDWEVEERYLPSNLLEVKELLEKRVDAPQLTDREQRLMNMLATHPQHSTHETKQLIAEGWEYCPLCLRAITDEDARSITNTLTKILNEEADKYSQHLETGMEVFRDITQVMPYFPGELHKNDVNAAQVAQDNLNKVLAAVRRIIEERKRRIYDAFSNSISGEIMEVFNARLSEWEKAMILLRKRVDDFNKTVAERRKLYDRIRATNNALARKQLSSLLLSYKQAEANSNSNKGYVEKKHNECQALEDEIKHLVQQKERTDIALDYINKELQYVFFSNKKVKLESGEGCYKLKVNGRNVKPSKISVGERNVLGLCYFFAKLYSGKTETTKYSSEYLIVIDDPVSSFDYGNRVGVMSLLRFQFNNIVKGNANSRILVMSHDLHSVFDLVKIRNEVAKDMGGDKSFMELANMKLEVKYLQNEYQKLLNHVYEYAVDNGADDPDETWEMSIGNMMRRMLEAFSSFNFNESFEKMVRQPDLLAMIPEGKRDYYESFMSRLTLNSESHAAESVYSLNTITPYYTREEKVQTAKSLLLFLLYINRAHMEAYFVEMGDLTKIATIERWQAEEATWIANK